MKKGVFWDTIAEENISIGKNHLFAVGIDNYSDGIRPLSNCVRDALRIADVLKAKYHFEDILTLMDQKATLENIIEELAVYTEKLTEQDNLIIYYSGHGYLKNGIGYLVPADAKNGKIYGLLNNEQLKSYIKNCNAKHILLIVDSCYSGSFLLKDKDLTELKGFNREAIKYPSRWVLAAGRIETVSDGEYGKHSPFATTLLTYLEENTDKVFSVSDLAQYVKNTTPHISAQTPIAGVLKDANDLGGEFIFIPQNTEKENFERCKTREDFALFLEKYPEGKFKSAAAEKHKALFIADAKEMFTQIKDAHYEQKQELVERYKQLYKEADRQLYISVLAEGKKAEDYFEWQRVNKESEIELELFILQSPDNFFTKEAQAIFDKKAEAKRQAAEKQKKIAEEKRIQEEKAEKERLNRIAEEKRIQEEKAEKERLNRIAEEKRIQEEKAEKERLNRTAEEKRIQEEKAEKERLNRIAEEKRIQEEKAEKERLNRIAEEKRVKVTAREKESEKAVYGATDTSLAEPAKNNSLYWKAGIIALVLLISFLGIRKMINSSKEKSISHSYQDSISEAEKKKAHDDSLSAKKEADKKRQQDDSIAKAKEKSITPEPGKSTTTVTTNPAVTSSKAQTTKKKAEPTVDPKTEEQAWKAALNRGTVSGYKSYLSKHPKGSYVATARNKINDLESQINRLLNQAKGLEEDGKTQLANDKRRQADALR